MNKKGNGQDDGNAFLKQVAKTGTAVVVGTIIGGLLAGPAGAAVGAKAGACCGGGLS